MIGYLLIICIIYILYFVVNKIVRRLIQERKHLSDETLNAFYKGKIKRDGEEYGSIIAHLGSCENCQNRLHQFDPNNLIEDHLIE